MEWHRTVCHRKKKFKAVLSASTIMATVFWDCEGVSFIEAQRPNDQLGRLCGNSEEAFPEGSSP
jgi:hypothetical protein